MKYNIENRSGLYINGVAYPDGLWSGGGYRAEYVDPVVNITRFPYVEIDTVIYDDSNIFIEFNDLVGTSTDSNVLVATDYDGYGIADDVTGTDLIGLSNISAEFEFSNISDDASTADTLVTNSPIQDGDNLVIVKDDDSIHELVASGVVTPTEAVDNGSFDDGTVDGWSSGFTYFASYDGRDKVGGFNVYVNGFIEHYYTVSGLVIGRTYVYKRSHKGVQEGVSTKHFSPGLQTLAGVDIVAAVNIGDGAYTTPWTEYEDTFVATTTEVRVQAKSYKSYHYLDDISIKLAHSSIDTTSITAGEIPSNAFTVDAKTSFAISGGYIDAVKSSDSYEIKGYDGADNDSIVNYIPLMGSNVSGDFVSSASGQIDASYAPWKAFNRVNTSGWGVAPTGNPWLNIKLDKPTAINKYMLSSRDFAGAESQVPKDWILYGSLSGAFGGEEVVLDTRVNENNWGLQEKRTYIFINGVEYLHYRMVISSNNGSNWLTIAQWELVKGLRINLFTTRVYKDLIDSLGSTTISPKVTLKSIRDKMTKMKFTTLKENT